MKNTDLRNIINVANELSIDVRELAENAGNDDFTIDEYRFVKESEALNILIDHYEGDTYILGCFNDWFIAECCDIDIEVVEALQSTENYEALGKLMLKNGIEDLIEEYIRLDGYGHAFYSYDGGHSELMIDGEEYIYFRA